MGRNLHFRYFLVAFKLALAYSLHNGQVITGYPLSKASTLRSPPEVP